MLEGLLMCVQKDVEVRVLSWACRIFLFIVATADVRHIQRNSSFKPAAHLFGQLEATE